MHRIIIQRAWDNEFVPAPTYLRRWAKTALKGQRDNAEVTLRIVGSKEMTELNSTFRKKQGPTNVLSFPVDLPADIKLKVPMLGDIILCADVINQEAREQQKTYDAHWAHMIVHGIFHLLGYDHVQDEDAQIMESLEINVLNTLGFANPYVSGDHRPHHE